MRHPLRDHNDQRYIAEVHTYSSLTMLARVTFVIVPSWPKLVTSRSNILDYTLITGQKLEQTFFIAIKSVICYVSLSSQSTAKSWCLINIYTDLGSSTLNQLLKWSSAGNENIAFSSTKILISTFQVSYAPIFKNYYDILHL